MYLQLNCWDQEGVLQWVFKALVEKKLLLSTQVCCLDSTMVKMHLHAHEEKPWKMEH
jgi:hypothetical protein